MKITWSETKYHEGMPYQESTDPRGYTVIAHDYGSKRITTATYSGGLKDHHGSVGQNQVDRENLTEKKAAIRKLKAACEQHYDKITGQTTAPAPAPAPAEGEKSPP